MTDGAKYAILYTEKDGEYQKAEVGGIRTKVIRAGDSLEIEAFPLLKRVTPAAKREARRRRDNRAAVDAVNRRNRKKHFRRLLEANFTPQDMHITLTYDYGFDVRSEGNREDIRREYDRMGFPIDDDMARRDLTNFMRRARRAVLRRGGDPSKIKYMYVMEVTYEPRIDEYDPLPPHYHFHIVMGYRGGKLPITRDEIEALWGKGYANADRLDFSNNGLKALANYLTKGRKYAQRWGHSKGLRQPVIRITDRAVSRRRAELVARDVRAFGREIFESIYKGYVLAEPPEVRYSDFTAGAYIYARLRKKPERGGKA